MRSGNLGRGCAMAVERHLRGASPTVCTNYHTDIPLRRCRFAVGGSPAMSIATLAHSQDSDLSWQHTLASTVLRPAQTDCGISARPHRPQVCACILLRMRPRIESSSRNCKKPSQTLHTLHDFRRQAQRKGPSLPRHPPASAAHRTSSVKFLGRKREVARPDWSRG